ncbi:MAG: hypothetical protein K0B14_10035 [Anaerolineaceae bacterium]|nr:hypothetical protein [Anaerolineaceae bacterium]
MEQQPMTLNQMMQAYQQLTSDFNTRKIDKASYSAALVRLRAIDEEKRWWSCTPEGGFVWYDGKQWIPGQAPKFNSPSTNPSQPFVQTAPITAGSNQVNALKKNTSSKGWRKITSTPILAILPGAVVGGLWFLFTLARLILSGGRGVDILTPVILTGVPLVLWLLRKPLDKLLIPLQKFQKSFPYAIRLGIAFAVPLLTGFGCSAIFTSGYTAMHFTALISTLFGYIVLRTPRIKNIS